MGTLLNAIADLLWPAHSISRTGQQKLDAYLKPLVLLMIVLLVGPELVAVVELTTLLELLGATMFLFAFAVAYKMLGVMLLKAFVEVLVPGECVTLIRARAPSAVVLGLALVARNGLLLFVVCFSPFAVFDELRSFVP
jgi:hypothetical protein